MSVYLSPLYISLGQNQTKPIHIYISTIPTASAIIFNKLVSSEPMRSHYTGFMTNQRLFRSAMNIASKLGDVAWWQMTKENKFSSVAVTFCSLIQIILVLLIAVKTPNQLLCSQHWSILRRSHLSGINSSAIISEKIFFSSEREKNVCNGLANLLIFRWARPSSPGSGACYWWRLASTGP